MKCSLIITTKNEESSIERLLDSVVSQTKIPDEIVIADAGSSDRTRPLALSYNKKLNIKLLGLDAGANRSIGRNKAIEAATHEIILITDAGCVLDKDWTKEMLDSFESKKVDVVAGFYRGESKNLFEKCQIPYVLVMPDRYDAQNFLPATRSMGIKKRVWKKMGGFASKFRYAEDYVFARTLKDRGFVIRVAPRAIVIWRARRNLISFMKMIYQHAQGDAYNGAWRIKVFSVFLRYFGFGFLFLIGKSHAPVLVLLILSIFSYVIYSIRKNYHYVDNLRACLYLPLLQMASDLMVMSGTLIGIVKRLIAL